MYALVMARHIFCVTSLLVLATRTHPHIAKPRTALDMFQMSMDLPPTQPINPARVLPHGVSN